MKKINVISVTSLIAILLFVTIGCNFSTANMSSLNTSKDAEGKEIASEFKSGDTLYANAKIGNNPGKVKVKYYLVADDVKGLTKGETLKGSDVSVDIEKDGVAKYNVPVAPGFLPGTYTLNADMLNEEGEKKDSKTAKVTVSGTDVAPSSDAPTSDVSDSNN